MMSTNSFETLQQNYIDLATSATIVPAREHELIHVAESLVLDKAIYQRIEKLTHVPAAMLMALAEREMNGSLHCYLGNGQLLKMRTTIVPIGRGPFLQTPPEDFIAG